MIGRPARSARRRQETRQTTDPSRLARADDLLRARENWGDQTSCDVGRTGLLSWGDAGPVVTGVVRRDLVSRGPDVAPMWPGSRALEGPVEPDQLERSDHRAPCFSEAQVAIQPDGAGLLGGRRHDQSVVPVGACLVPWPSVTGPQGRQGAAVRACAGKVPAGWIRFPARSAGSLPAGRLPAGPGDPLDEPGWSLRSEDQAGNHHGDGPLWQSIWSARAGGSECRPPVPLDAQPTPQLFTGQPRTVHECCQVLSWQLASGASSSQCVLLSGRVLAGGMTSVMTWTGRFRYR